MTDTPTPPLPEEKDDKNTSPSLLNEILQNQQQNTPPITESTIPQGSNPEMSPTPKKPREPISFADFMKFAGALLFVAAVFFGSFLAYIVINPEQAMFLENMFGIQRDAISILLKKLINGSFGLIMFVVSVVWIITLFRAIWTPRDLKRKRLLSWLLAWFIGIILFSLLSLWAFLFNKLWDINFENLDGSILLYDNDLYQNTETRGESLLWGSNVIWPINVLFELRSNAERIRLANNVTIQSYTINTDGGNCNNGSSIITGNNVLTESSIVCQFDTVKTYNITGNYTVMTRDGTTETITMNINPLEVRGLVKVTRWKNIQWGSIMTLDASGIKTLGNPRWMYLPSRKIVDTSSITEAISSTPLYVCLSIINDECDRIFIMMDTDSQKVTGSISSIPDAIDPLVYNLSISGVSLDMNQVTRIEWLIVDQNDAETVICSTSNDSCKYRFNAYGRHRIRVVLILGNGQKYPIETTLLASEPLKLSRNMKVLDENGTLLNTPNTYQTDIKAYLIENTLTPPVNIILDARDITATDMSYTLKDIVWKLSNGKKVEEKRGSRVTMNLSEPLRYTIEWTYTFEKKDSTELLSAREIIIIDIERKNLMPRADISLSSDYIPSVVTVDASQSVSEDGEIKKFIFDFGEGKIPAEWDAVQQYEYKTAWEKEITVTIISEDGERAEVKKTIVLKDVARTIEFVPSMSTGIVGASIDFEAAGTNGQVQEYIWNFWDNTPTTRWYSTAHTYTTEWVYLVELTVVYTDGTQDSLSRRYTVEKENQ